MGRADLDMVEAALEAGLLLDKRHWSDLVAELRVAREALRLAPRPPRFRTNTAEYVAALAAYDRHVQQIPEASDG